MANQVIFDIGWVWIKHAFIPPSHQMQSICVREGSKVPNLQMEFNYLNSFKSYGIFSDFVVPTWSPWSPHHRRHPHIIPVIPTSSLSSPHHPRHPHVVPIAPRRSPCGPHGCGLCCLHWGQCGDDEDNMDVVHIIPIIPTSSPLPPEGPHVVSMAVVSVVSTGNNGDNMDVVPVIPMSSLCHLEGPHIIPNPQDTHLIHPHPPGGGGLESAKML